MSVSGCLFSAMLLDMRAPNVRFDPASPSSAWPYHLPNLEALINFNMYIMAAIEDGAGFTYQCSYCGKGWSGKTDSVQREPKVACLVMLHSATLYQVPFKTVYDGTLEHQSSGI